MQKRKRFSRLTFANIKILFLERYSNLLILAYNTFFCKPEAYQYDEVQVSLKFFNVFSLARDSDGNFEMQCFDC